MSEQHKIYAKTACPLDCPDSCGLVATVENGKVTGLSGDYEHPYTRGIICRKMKSYHQRLYSKDRILFPMKRTGKKGDSRFTRISWDDAYSMIVERTAAIKEEFGGETILPFVYAGNMGAMNRFAGYPLFHKLGTSRLEETICSTAAKAGWKSQCGDIPGSPPEKAEDAELVIIWGSNTKVTNLHFWPYVAAARKKGAKLVVIDPYRNDTAASADLHLKVEPGGDTALALALLKILVGKEAVDYSFIENSTSGFEELKRYLDSISTVDCVRQSGIEQARISALAESLQSTAKIFIRIGIGMTRHSRAGLGIRGITSLAAALGLFDGGEGRGVLLSSAAYVGNQEILTWPSLAEKKTRRFNMVQLGNCLTSANPPVKMLMVYNANPLSVTPDSGLVRQALANEELFTVVHEQVMTPTAKYADLLLPATTFLENRDLYTGYGHFYLSVVDPVIEPLGEAKSNFVFYQELAEKFGYDDPPFRQTLDQRMTAYLETLAGLPDCINIKDMKNGEAIRSTRWSGGEPLFSPEKGRYTFIQDQDPSLPRTACLLEGDEFDNADYPARFPFKLITPPHMDLLNSTFGERYEGHPGEVIIHPQDAEECGVQDKELITLYNNRGWNRRKAKISDTTRKGLLVAEGIFWQYDNHPSGVNDLTSQKLTDMGGGGTFHESRVAVLKKT
ncbi:molybdopterin-dependent oxidoreductase [Desulfopila inferna]|uniref:molybdopterin-dependent oxidoreductase n=1 Tax=Desulfopila inferna TaxID=468528 RepID=UPI001962ADE3|nr:molybdopterin-dependent oxidoreductase [Desulfopila inferna]MBM9605897.1 molybdopterin-dependent oxidoreductase [Desulfopila inferna]